MLEIKELKSSDERTLISRESSKVVGGLEEIETAGTSVNINGVLHPDQDVPGGTEWAVVNDHREATGWWDWFTGNKSDVVNGAPQ